MDDYLSYRKHFTVELKVATSPVLVSDKPLTSSNVIIGKRKPLHSIEEDELILKVRLSIGLPDSARNPHFIQGSKNRRVQGKKLIVCGGALRGLKTKLRICPMQ